MLKATNQAWLVIDDSAHVPIGIEAIDEHNKVVYLTTEEALDLIKKGEMENMGISDNGKPFVKCYFCNIVTIVKVEDGQIIYKQKGLSKAIKQKIRGMGYKLR